MSDRSNKAAFRPELLAAYVDGELDGAAQAEVKAWLTAHPEAAADVEAQQRLARLWEQADPPAPSGATWATTLAGVELRLSQPVARPTWRRRVGFALGLTALVTTAAAVAALAVRLDRPGPGTAIARDEQDEEPFPVLTVDEVRIESMHDADAGALVVGEPPVRAPLQLLTAAEVKVRGLDRDDRGRTPRVHTEEKSGVPMIVMPPVTGADREP